MEVCRNIYLNFWSDMKASNNFTLEDKYFYLYLFTNSQTNICGCYEISYGLAEKNTGITQEKIKVMLERFDKVYRLIRFNPETNEILLLNWYKYSWDKLEKKLSRIRKVAIYIKTMEFKEHIFRILECIKNDEACLENFDQKEEILAVPPKTFASFCANMFEDFWSAYPKKQRRHLAEKAYCDLISSGIVSEKELVLAAERYANHIKESGDKIFFPNNFLEKYIFEDYLQPKEPEISRVMEVLPKPEEESEPDAEQLVAEGWIDPNTMSNEEFEEYLKRVIGNDV